MSVNSDNIGPITSGSFYLNTILRSFSNVLKIAHINCQSIRPSSNSCKFDEFRNVMDKNFNLIAVSETWLKPYVSTKSIRISGYNIIRNDRLFARGGGVAIFVSDQITFTVLSKVSLPGCESIFVELESGDFKVLFGVVYLPYGDLELFETSHYELLSRHKDIIIVGDFNCNMFDVGKAVRLRSMCVRCNLYVSHNSRPTYLDIAHDTTSLLDIWLMSDTSYMKFSDQVQCPMISYHALIFAAFEFEVRQSYRYLTYRDFNSIDWDGLIASLGTFDFALFYGLGNIELQSSFINSLIDTLFRFVPVVSRRICIDNNSWMKSGEILLSTSLRDLAYSAFRSAGSVENWQIYCRYRNRAKNVIRRVRRAFYSKLFSGLDNSGMWKLLKGCGVTGDDEYISNLNVDDVNNFFVNASVSDNHELVDFGSFIDMNESFSFHCVSELEVLGALYRIRSKSVGIDGIPIRFLKVIFPYISRVLTWHINQILTTSSFPSAWKTARVVPIPKSTVVHSVDDLRPISILPSISKILEHIMKDQILLYVRNQISPSQYAFRRGHSTTSLLLNLTDDIRCGLNEGNLTAMLSLDLSKAFNSVNFSVLISKLKNLFKFSSSACRLILSYLCDRFQFVDIGGTYSGLLPLSSGVPQGSVLGPLLFMLYVNDLPDCIDTPICKSFLFADDIMLLFRTGADSSDILQSNIDYALRRFLQWSTANNLLVNSSKTKAILFGNLNLPELTVSIGDSIIDFVDRLRCLGVYIDRRLNFEYHIDRVSFKVIGILRRLYSIGVFLPIHIRNTIAHTILMPQVMYGLEVISGTVAYCVSRLKRIMNMIVRYVYNVRNRMHISVYVQCFLGCSFRSFILYRNLLNFYKVIRSGLPVQLRSEFIFSHSSRNPQLIIPRIRYSVFERSFVIRIARSWNILPLELRLFSHTNNVFRLKLLRHLSVL